jgi:predicted nucleotidyltransferase
MHSTLERALANLGIADQVPNLKEAARLSDEIVQEARQFLTSKFSTEKTIDVVLLGSIARGEASKESDFDYLLLAYSLPPKPRDTREILAAADEIPAMFNLDPPGTSGIFGKVVSSTDLTERIGLEQDTNLTQTRRILILEESVSVFQPDKHEDLVRKMLQRYLVDYSKPKSGVPRFLLNDVLKYWRTVAVDYQAKRWEGLEQQWGLRYLKLLISRKLAFAGTLVSLLLTKTATEDHLYEQFSMPALARFAQLEEQLDAEYKELLKECFLIANRFSAALGDEKFRKEALLVRSRDDIKEDSHFFKMRQQADRLQECLQQIFFASELLRERSIKYLSF